MVKSLHALLRYVEYRVTLPTPPAVIEATPDPSGRPPLAEREQGAFDLWATEYAFDLKKVAKELDIPYSTVWRWKNDHDWQGRYASLWADLVGPGRAVVQTYLAAGASEIVRSLFAVATDSSHPAWAQAQRLVRDYLVDDGSKPLNLTLVDARTLMNFGKMTEEEMEREVNRAIQLNLQQSQAQRTRRTTK